MQEQEQVLPSSGHSMTVSIRLLRVQNLPRKVLPRSLCWIPHHGLAEELLFITYLFLFVWGITLHAPATPLRKVVLTPDINPRGPSATVTLSSFGTCTQGPCARARLALATLRPTGCGGLRRPPDIPSLASTGPTHVSYAVPTLPPSSQSVAYDHLAAQSLHSKCTSCATAVKKTASGASISYLACKACKGPAGPTANAYVTYTNFGVTPPKSTCKCAARFYNAGGDMTTCSVCPKGSYCPGVAGLVNGAAIKTACASGLTTISTGATSAAACVTQPGFGYSATTNTASVCALGTYSAGGTNQPCTACPAGLTTAATAADGIGKCAAPPGMYYVNATRQALPCPQGTYKVDVSQATSCTRCPTGITTASTKSSAPTQCDRAVAAGYIATLENGQMVPQACAVGSYSSNGRTCTTCPDDLTTASRGATTSADCLAAPGWGYDVNHTPKTYPCPGGSYKAGWNKLSCVSCGTNVLTDTSATNGLGLSADQCYISPGWGSQVDANGKLVARQCLLGKYGAPEAIYGVAARPCQPCPQNTVTDDQFAGNAATPPYISPDSCLAKPGYCWANNIASKAPVGYYKPGYNNMDCSTCGTGLTTLQEGADEPSDCVPLPGWEKQAASDDFAAPCLQGYYSAGGDSAVACTACPLGSTTQSPMSNDVSQCAVCFPGWGANPNYPGAGQDVCSKCEPGTFSPGGSDNACIPCQQGETSAPGASDSSDCFDEFMDPHPYDMVTTPSAAWVAAADAGISSTTSTADECEVACKATERCQYYIFRADQEDTTAGMGDGCFFKMAPATGDANTFTAFKLFTGDYVVWQAAAAEYPTDADSAFDPAPTDPAGCLSACDDMASCMAVFITKGSDWECHRVDGDYSTTGTVVSAIKAEPNRINTKPWL